VPNPISVYARSKLGREAFVRSVLPDSFVVRTGLVFGGVADFLTGGLRRLAVGEEARSFVDRTETPDVREAPRRASSAFRLCPRSITPSNIC
jgi:dTDP-4-dehydrorhamnose reductase